VPRARRAGRGAARQLTVTLEDGGVVRIAADGTHPLVFR
jgi:hypothetical protein